MYRALLVAITAMPAVTTGAAPVGGFAVGGVHFAEAELARCNRHVK